MATRRPLTQPVPGIRNTCTACHTDANMASHAGAVFTRGDYREELTCLSCHMPWAGRSNSSADVSIVGTAGRMGDVRSHIFRVDTDSVTYNDMLTPDGTQVRTDSAGCAGVSIDFVCLRCHTDEDAATNSAFPPTHAARRRNRHRTAHFSPTEPPALDLPQDPTSKWVSLSDGAAPPLTSNVTNGSMSSKLTSVLSSQSPFHQLHNG